MRVAGTTLGYLHHRATLAEALESLAGVGFGIVDLSPTPPHLYLPGSGGYERRQLKRLLKRLGLECASVNPTELNLVSTNLAYAELSRHQLGLCLELAHDLESGYVVFAPGRLFALNPAPVADAHAALVGQLERLLPAAERLGVVLAVETVPFGFMQTGGEVAEIVDRIDSPWLRATYDVANTFANESLEVGLRDLGDRLHVMHISGAWTDRWAHASVSEGDIDFAAVAAALRERGFSGPTVYELIDGSDPQERLRADAALLTEWGWELG
jgi:sugar phosphate isomerase/epimerase